MMHTRRPTFAAVALLAAVGLASAGPSQSATKTTKKKPKTTKLAVPTTAVLTTRVTAEPNTTKAPATTGLDALIAQSKAEGGKLQITWDTLGTKDEVKGWTELFQKTYGFPVNVEITPGPSFPTNAAKLIQEAQANQKTAQDVFLGAETQFIDLIARNVMLPLDASEIPNVKSYVEGGVAVPLLSRISGFTYNSDRVRNPPQTLNALIARTDLNIAVSVTGTGFPILAARSVGSTDEALDTARRMAKVLRGQINCGDAQRPLLSGEFDVFAMDCGETEALAAQAKGAPIGHVVPFDLPILGFWYIGVPKNASHPATAKLWVNLMMSRAGQDVLFKGDFADLHTFPGSNTAKRLKDDEFRGIKFIVTTIAWAQANPEPYGEFRRTIQAILRGQR